MRVITLATLLVPSIAAADSFFELAGGLSDPVGDDDWNDRAEPSPKLALRAGGFSSATEGRKSRVGAVLSADWTPQQTDADGFTFPGGMTEVSAQRFRLLIGPGFEARVAPALHFSARLGIGADIAHASATTTTIIGSASASDTDVGFALEVGTGFWVDLGSLQIGGEIALPIGYHNHQADNSGDEITMDWTSYDVDILGGVRFVQ